jgi:hypothetical protein
MKLQYLNKAKMTSNGITFGFDIVYEFSKEEGERLLKAFPAKFKLVEEPKVEEPKPKVRRTSKVTPTKQKD